MSNLHHLEIDIQVSDRENTGEFQIEAYALSQVPGETFFQTAFGITLFLHHVTADTTGLDDDRWFGVVRYSDNKAPDGISQSEWDMVIQKSFDRLDTLLDNR